MSSTTAPASAVTEFEVRRWQQEAGPEVMKHHASFAKGGKGALVVASTGSGKTAGCHLWLNELAFSRGLRTLWVAAQDELVFQPEATLRRWWPHVTSGIVKAERNQPGQQATYASLATLSRAGRLDAVLAYGVPAVCVIDEAHESKSRSYRKLIDRLDELGVYRIGLTATPERGDGQSLSDLWDLVYDYPLLDAIEDGCIVQPYVSECRLPDLHLDQISITRGDYDQAELERELMRAHVVEHTVEALGKEHRAVSLPFRDRHMSFNPRDGGALVHTVTVDQAVATTEALLKDGWIARTVWGGMPKGDRRRIIKAYNEGKINALCSPAALAQGTDLPFAMTNVLARPTRSHRLYVQIKGRVLRPYDLKPGGLTIDLVGASKEHSLIGAPVLIEGAGCPSHDNGKHAYLATPDGGGRCDCGATHACWKSKGPHKFSKGRCVACGAIQCTESPSGNHIWMPREGGYKQCLCGMEIRDRLFSLAAVRPHKEPVAWRRLPIDREVWAVDLGRVGRLFNIRHGTLWEPVLVTKRGVNPLHRNGPVSPELARLLTDDVARQAKKVNGWFGGMPSPTSERVSQIQTMEAAKRLLEVR